MKKFLISLAWFFCVAFLFYLLLIFTTSNIKVEKKFSVLDKITGNATAGKATFWRFYDISHYTRPYDVVITGASPAYRSFDTRVFDKNHLNAHIIANGQQPPAVTYQLLKDYVIKVKPKLIIFDVCLAVNNSNGVEAFYDLSKNIPVSWTLFYMALEINQVNVYHNFFSALLNQCFKPLYLNINFPRPKTYYKGFITEYKNDTTIGFNRVKRSYKFNKTTAQEDKSLDCIESIVRLSRKNKIEILFTRQPAIWNYNISLLTKVIAIANKYNVPFIDLYNEQFRLNPGFDFYDRSHLNSLGARKITRILLEEKLRQDPKFDFLWSDQSVKTGQ